MDDDFRVRESLDSLLQSVGYQVVLFASAGEFLDSGILAHAACVITDVRMPLMDGIELQRRIRKLNPGLPVIFMSAHVNEETRKLAFKDGAIDFLYKPFDAAELLRVVQTALSRA